MAAWTRFWTIWRGINQHVDVDLDINTYKFTALESVQLFITDGILWIKQTSMHSSVQKTMEITWKERLLCIRRSGNWLMLMTWKNFLASFSSWVLNHCPELSLCWSTNHLFYMPVYGASINGDRFLLLLMFLHLKFNDTVEPLKSYHLGNWSKVVVEERWSVVKKSQSLPAGHAANCRSHWPVSVQTRPAAPWLPAPHDSSETPAILGSAIQTSHLMDQFLFPCMQTLLLWDTCQHYGPVSLSMHIPCFSEASAILGSAIQTHNFMGLFLSFNAHIFH